MDINRHLKVLDPLTTADTPEMAVSDLLETAHNEPIDIFDHSPPWRLYVRPVQTPGRIRQLLIAFSTSHAIADGTSCLLFHQTFARALRDTDSLPSLVNGRLETHSTAEPSSPLEECATLPISWSFLLSPLIGEYCPIWIKRALGVSTDNVSDSWSGASSRPARPTPSHPLRTGLKCAKIPSATTQHVLSTCRAHGVRLTGLLIVLTSRALAQKLQDRKQQHRRFQAETAIDLRRQIQATQGSMGNFPSATTSALAVSDPLSKGMTSDDWSTASRVTDSLEEAAGSLSDQPVALLRYLSDFRGWTIRKSEQPTNLSFSVSNVGMFKNGVGDETENLSEMAFSQSADATGAPFNLNVVSTKTGPLSIVVTWWPGMLGVDDEGSFMTEVCGSIVEQLKEIGD